MSMASATMQPDMRRQRVMWPRRLAAIDGRSVVTLADVRQVIVPVLRHRIGLSFRAEVDRVTIEDLIQKVVAITPEPKGV